MRIRLIIAICLTFIFTCFTGCKGISDNGVKDIPTDTVAIKTITLCDSLAFTISHSNTCEVRAKVSIDYPDLFKDTETSQRLQKLYISDVLELPDTLSIDGSAAQYLENILSEYKSADDSENTFFEPEDDGPADFMYKIFSNIAPCFNQSGILSFSKADTTQKNDAVTKTKHAYYNIDLNTLSIIHLSQVIKSEFIDDVTNMLKRQLISQNHVKDESSLIDLGYFNLDNLVANDNFHVSTDGITWNYQPYEIACYSVGETEITLSFESLKPFLVENSVVYNIIK